MKKQFFFGMVAAAALCGCSNNEVEQFQANEQNAIQFGVYVGQSVNGRAAQTVLTNVESPITPGVSNKGGFGIFGYYTGQDNYTTGKTPNFMYNQQVEKKSGTWTYTPLKYWPNTTGDKVSFFAYSPYSPSNATGSSTSETDTDNITAFSANTDPKDPTVTFSVNNEVKKQQDLLYAQALNKKQTITTGTADLKIADPVTFAFQHALSCIGFNVEASFDKVIPETGTTDNGSDNGTKPSETTIAVTSVKLIGNFYTSGTLNLSKTAAESPWTTTPAQNTTTFSLTSSTDANTNFTAVSNYGVLTEKKQLNAEDSYIMVIPQAFTESNDQIKIEVVYKVKTTDTALSGGFSEITHKVESAPFNFTFEQGKKHWFNLHLGLTSASFDATVTDWENSDTAAETIVNVPLNQAKNSSTENE